MIRIKTLFNVKGFCLLYLIFLLISIFFLLAYTNNGLCKNGEGGENKSDIEDRVIVNVGEKRIKGADFNAYLSYRPLAPPNTVTNEVLGQRLNEIITSEALYQEAYIKQVIESADIQRDEQAIIEVFKAIKEAYVKEYQKEQEKFQPKYRNTSVPPPFPG